MNPIESISYNLKITLLKLFYLENITFKPIAENIIESNAPLVLSEKLMLNPLQIASVIIDEFKDDSIEKIEYKDGNIYLYGKE